MDGRSKQGGGIGWANWQFGGEGLFYWEDSVSTIFSIKYKLGYTGITQLIHSSDRKFVGEQLSGLLLWEQRKGKWRKSKCLLWQPASGVFGMIKALQTD